MAAAEAENGDQQQQRERLGRLLRRYAGGMTEIVAGLYVGNLRDAVDEEQLSLNGITHVVSVHDLTRAHPIHDQLKVKVMRVRLSDRPDTSLAPYISLVNDFIHDARLNKGGRVLVHCLAGASRSVSFAVAYLLTVTDVDYWRCLNAVARKRHCANPNFGFRMQLTKFAANDLPLERARLRAKFGAGRRWDDRFVADSASVRGDGDDSQGSESRSRMSVPTLAIDAAVYASALSSRLTPTIDHCRRPTSAAAAIPQSTSMPSIATRAPSQAATMAAFYGGAAAFPSSLFGVTEETTSSLSSITTTAAAVLPSAASSTSSPSAATSSSSFTRLVHDLNFIDQ